MSIWKRKKHKYTMNMDAANATLQNVFASCDKEPNSIPFDKIVLRTKLNTRSYTILLVIFILLLAITLSLPLIFHSSLYHISRKPGSSLVLEEHYQEDGLLYFILSGDTVFPQDSYLLDEKGNEQAPINYNEETNTLIFDFPDAEVNIYISDSEGNYLHLLVTPD